jgi:cytoskeletal protein RodZ
MKSKTKKSILVLSVIIIVIISGIFLWYFLLKEDKSQLNVSDATKKQAEQKAVEQAKSVDNKNSNQGQTASPPANEKPSLDITTAEQVDDRLIVSILVNNANNGTCTITLKNGTSIITRTAPVGQQVSYNVCQGFIINSNEINPKGDWDLTVKLDSAKGIFETSSRRINIK